MSKEATAPVSSDLAVTAPGLRALSVGFAPATVRPPRRRLRGLEAAAAGVRNPIELWDEELFSVPSREIRRFGCRFVEITEPALMHEVLVKQSAAFARSEFQLRFTRPLVGNGILAARGEDWRMQRKAGAPCFRSCAIDELAPAINRAGARAVAKLRDAAGGMRDVMPVAMSATFEIVAALLGIEVALLDQAAVAQAADDYLRGVGLGAVAEIFGFGWLHRMLPLKGKRAIAGMRAQAERAIVSACSSKARGGLLHNLAEAFAKSASDPLASLRDSVIAFIAAGNETSAVGLAWALYLIANDPIVQRRLAQEAQRELGAGDLTPEALERLDLHKNVVKEALRLFPPIALMQRTAVSSVSIGGFDFRPGDEAVCAIYVMHRSERIWKNPAQFDPDRFTEQASAGRHRLAYMPFGAGAHACLGMPLAIAEMTGILALLTRELQFAADPTQQMRPVMRLTLRPEQGVKLAVTQRRRPLVDEWGSLPERSGAYASVLAA